MKTVLFLALLCGAAVLNGCTSANQGGTTDTYDTSTGSKYMYGPTTAEPSLPQGPYNNEDPGPQIPPP